MLRWARAHVYRVSGCVVFYMYSASGMFDREVWWFRWNDYDFCGMNTILCIFVYIYKHMCMCVYIHKYIYTCIYIYIYIHVYVYVYIYTSITNSPSCSNVCHHFKYMYMHIYIYICIYVYTYISVKMYIYIYICMYICMCMHLSAQHA